MSNSAIIAARKRIETNLRSFNLPTEVEPSMVDSDNAKNGPLLMSLLQSRLNWLTTVFVKYRHDAIQQPRRAANTRRKWPNMRFLGTCTVELGPHSFPETSFYEAIRTESWTAIAEAAGLGALAAVAEDGKTEPQEEENKSSEHTEKKDMIYSDVVMEFKEVPGERVLFPKDMVVQVTSQQEPFDVLGSFLLPLDPATADDFFQEPKEKIALWGHQSNIPQLCQPDTGLPLEPQSAVAGEEKMYQPANIWLRQVDATLLHAILSIVHSSDVVCEQMRTKLTTVPKRAFLQLSKADKAIEDLVQKACTVPEIVSGPVQAEKKRNETLNAVRLGKRSRNDLSEECSPKGKSTNNKDDGFRKCHYCSTKSTSMWRAGPEGAGTLCNGCGLLWSQDKILKGAPIISRDEEKRRIREQWEKEQEQREDEEWEREAQRQKAEASRPSRPEVAAVAKASSKAATVSCPSSQPQLQNQAPALVSVAPHPPPPPPLPSITVQDPSPPLKEKPTPSPLYNSKLGIPLPTLSIDFGPEITFVHPNCSVTLKNACFSVKLGKEGHPTATVNISKNELKNAKFEVTQDDGMDMQKAVLILTVEAAEEGPRIREFDTDLLTPKDKTRRMVIKFLEKRDTDGDGIVKRILETWLDTPIVSESPSPVEGDQEKS